jgi:hypothetical protein
MTSTRNKNTRGDYAGEARINNNTVDYYTNKHYLYGAPLVNYYPGDGLLQGKVASENLSHNNIDIETQLFGIGSTNLVDPKINYAPELKPLQSLSVFYKYSVLIPEPLVVHQNQRPYPSS